MSGSIFQPPTLPPTSAATTASGWMPAESDVELIARVAFSAGDLVLLDLENDDGDVDDNTVPGDDSSGFRNAVDPVATAESHGIFAIALEDAAVDTKFKARLFGIVDASVHKATAGALAPGDPLTADAGVEVNSLEIDAPAATENRKILAIGLTTVADATTPSVVSVLFNGVTGFGHLFTET